MFAVFRKRSYLNFSEKHILQFTECTVLMKDCIPQQNTVSVKFMVVYNKKQRHLHGHMLLLQ